jgi:hypothetical protein
MRGHDDEIEFFVSRNLADARSCISRFEYPGALDERKLFLQKGIQLLLRDDFVVLRHFGHRSSIELVGFEHVKGGGINHVQQRNRRTKKFCRRNLVPLTLEVKLRLCETSRCVPRLRCPDRPGRGHKHCNGEKAVRPLII